MQILPIDQQAVRDDNYKLVRKQLQVCGTDPTNDTAQTVNEFYKIDESVPIPLIDKDGTALCEGTACPSGLSQGAAEDLQPADGVDERDAGLRASLSG